AAANQQCTKANLGQHASEVRAWDRSVAELNAGRHRNNGESTDQQHCDEDATTDQDYPGGHVVSSAYLAEMAYQHDQEDYKEQRRDHPEVATDEIAYQTAVVVEVTQPVGVWIARIRLIRSQHCAHDEENREEYSADSSDSVPGKRHG